MRAVGDQMKQMGQEVAGNGMLQRGKDCRVTGGGALEVLPFQLQGALESQKCGLGEAASGFSEQADAMGPGSDHGGDQGIGFLGGANEAAQKTVARNQLDLGGSSTEESSVSGARPASRSARVLEVSFQEGKSRLMSTPAALWRPEPGW